MYKTISVVNIIKKSVTTNLFCQKKECITLIILNSKMVLIQLMDICHIPFDVHLCCHKNNKYITLADPGGGGGGGVRKFDQI